MDHIDIVICCAQVRLILNANTLSAAILTRSSASTPLLVTDWWSSGWFGWLSRWLPNEWGAGWSVCRLIDNGTTASWFGICGGDLSCCSSSSCHLPPTPQRRWNTRLGGLLMEAPEFNSRIGLIISLTCFPRPREDKIPRPEDIDKFAWPTLILIFHNNWRSKNE